MLSKCRSTFYVDTSPPLNGRRETVNDRSVKNVGSGNAVEIATYTVEKGKAASGAGNLALND